MVVYIAGRLKKVHFYNLYNMDVMKSICNDNVILISCKCRMGSFRHLSHTLTEVSIVGTPFF